MWSSPRRLRCKWPVAVTPDRFSAVIARLDRAIQYSRHVSDGSIGRGLPDHPLELVIGLAEGETRWRVTTDEC
jgi:hypothetical protein